MRFFITLRGVELEVEGTVSDADPDAGIVSDYCSDFNVISPDEAKDWDYTDEEVAAIDAACVAAYDADQYDDQSGDD